MLCYVEQFSFHTSVNILYNELFLVTISAPFKIEHGLSKLFLCQYFANPFEKGFCLDLKKEIVLYPARYNNIALFFFRFSK